MQLRSGFAVLLAIVVAFGAAPAASDCTKTSVGLTPVNYVRSAQTLSDGLAAAALVEPLDVNGSPDPNGLIGFLLLGNSNTQYVGQLATNWYNTDILKRPAVRFVNAAIGGRTATEWADPNDAYSAWSQAATKLGTLAPAQVQWVHFGLTQKNPDTMGAMTAQQVSDIFTNLLARYPNVKGVWLSGMNYVGYSNTGLLYEPYAYGDSVLLASLVGTLPVWTDFLDWWSDGTTPNPLTGIAWACGDSVSDGVHPHSTGRAKLSLLMLDRWRVDPVMAWLWK